MSRCWSRWWRRLAKEVNEGLVLMFRYGDGRRGYRKVDCGDGDDVVLDMEADVEVNQEVGKEVANVANVNEFPHVGRV